MWQGCLGIVLILALAGCAVFTADKIQDTSLPIPSGLASKPGLHIEFNFYRGQPDNASARSIPIAREGLEPMLLKTLESSGLFDHYSLAPEPARSGDYVLKLKLYNHSPMAASVASGMLTGATLFLVPGVARDDFTLTGELLDPALQPIAVHRNDDAIRTWMGVWFIPWMSHSTEEAISDTFTRQVKDLLKTLVAEQSTIRATQ
jgi:hypothetical protein